jgi:hypothetical protein
MTCPYCHGRGTITEPSQHSYSYGATITRSCYCTPPDPPQRGPSSDELLYGPRRAAK